MKKRGQAAMEFLMTYGWAFVIVIAVLAGLFYLGVFNQTKQNTIVNFQNSYQKGMQATSPFDSFLDYHNNLNDIALHKNAGTSSAMETSLSLKDMQGLLKNNFQIS